MKKEKIKTLFLLHFLLLIYSISSVLGKIAAQQTEIISVKCMLLCFFVFVLLALYAIGWQQVIKRIPLTTAFANKAITIVWGIVFGVGMFDEVLTTQKIIGAVMVIAGMILFVRCEVCSTEDSRQ